MNLNFVFDRISDHGIPIGNVLCFKNDCNDEQLKATNNLPDPYWRGFWWEYSGYGFRDTFRNNKNLEFTQITKYIKTSDLNNYTQDLNIYPIFTHGVGDISAFTIELLYYLDKSVTDAVNNDILKIALLNLYDPWLPNEEQFAKNLIGVCNRTNIKNKKNVIIVCPDNDLWIEKTKNSLSKFGDNVPKLINAHWWEQVTRIFLENNDQNKIDYVQLYNNSSKEKTFTYLINRPTYNRYFLYKYLQKENLTQNGFISVRQPMQLPEFDEMLKDLKYYNIENEITGPLVTDFENYLLANKNVESYMLEENGAVVKQENFCPMRVGSLIDLNWIKNSLFTVYSETVFEQHFLSEKTYKLFYYGHPFMVYGKQGILKKIQNLGYKTFPMLFDESYDDLSQKSILKIKSIIDQIKFFTTEEGKEKFNKVLPEVCEVLEYNRKRLVNSNQYEFWIKLNNL